MPTWLVPMVYTVVSVLAGLTLPRLEQGLLGGFSHQMSLGSALAFFSAVSSGMMALTGIVFDIAFVVVQFSALAYLPRLVITQAGGGALFHSLGVFFATCTDSLAALMWTHRGGSGIVPLFSTLLVACLLIDSMLAFARLIQSVNKLQIHYVLQEVGARGRALTREIFPVIEDGENAETDGVPSERGAVTQVLTYSGEPLVIAHLDVDALVRLAHGVNDVVAMEYGVGETLIEDTVLLRVLGGDRRLPEVALLRPIRLATTRTFEQDPKYAIRLLVDIEIRALSPAINDSTTTVQALDQIQDLLRRFGRRQLDAGYVRDAAGNVRLTFTVPSWQDYLALSFDEIRQYGATSVQVVRRLRAALVGLGDAIAVPDRRADVLRYLDHLNRGISRSCLDDQDQAAAQLEDRQGLGLTRRRVAVVPLPSGAMPPASDPIGA